MKSIKKLFLLLVVAASNFTYSQKAEKLNYNDLQIKALNFTKKIDSLSKASTIYNKVITIELYKTEKKTIILKLNSTYENYASNELNKHYSDIKIENTTIPIYKEKKISINFSKEFEIIKKKKSTNGSSDFDTEIPMPPPPPSTIDYYEKYSLQNGKLIFIEKKYNEIKYQQF